MIRTGKVICFVMLALLLTSLYCYYIGSRSFEKVVPENTMEQLTHIEDAAPSKEDDKSIKVQEQLQVSPMPSDSEKVEIAPSLPNDHGESVNLQEHSYSIKNEKKDIPITPGISLQRGKSVNVKIPGGEEIIRIQRDKNYHPGGYNVLWEKKY